jgi:uncharacterized protein (TIGR02466 family)
MQGSKKLEVLPQIFYEFDVPPDVIELALTEAKKLDWSKINNRNNQQHFGKSLHGMYSWHNQNKFKKIVNYVEERLNYIKEDQNYEYIERLKISILWANKSVKGQWHHTHMHPWSLLSGIMYLEGDSGRTWFARTNEYHDMFKWSLCDVQKSNPDLIYKHEYKPGTMLIFPSSIVHSVEAITTDTERYTLAFNSFADGLIGKNEDLNSVNVTIS